MSTTTDLGKVGMTPKQIYDSTTTYERLDVVTHHGCSYVCLKDCAGIEVTNTEYWQLLADKGHFTEQDKEAFKQAVVTDSKIEINEHTEAKKTELDNYTSDFETSLKNELDTYEIEKEAQLDIHKTTLETEMSNTKDSLVEEIETAQNGFNDNVTAKTTAFNNNATAKTTAFNNNVIEKTNTFNSNAETKTTDFDTNANTKKTEFNNNSTAKLEEYNNNSATKLEEYNSNDTAKLEAYNNNATEKTNSFNSNAEEKTVEFNENVESYKKRITKLETEVEELSQQAPWKTTDIAESIHITDSAKYSRNKLIPFGNMEQETREGYNVVDVSEIPTQTKNGVTFTNNGDGTLTLNGTATDNFGLYTPVESKTIPAGNYTKYMTKDTNIKSNLTISLGVVSSGSISQTSLQPGTGIGSLELEEDLTYNQLRMYIGSGTVFNNYVLKWMIVKGTYTSETIPPFEQYGAMPSLEYSSMPVVATGIQKIKNLKRNMLDCTKFKANKYIQPIESTENSISLHGINKFYTGVFQEKKLKPNTTYTIRAEVTNCAGNATGGVYIFNSTYSKTGDIGYTGHLAKKTIGTTNTTGNLELNFTTDNAGVINILLQCNGAANTATITYENIQLEEGEESTEIKAQDIYSLDLGTTELAKIVDADGNVLAQDKAVYREVDGVWKWQWKKNVGKDTINSFSNRASTLINSYVAENLLGIVFNSSLLHKKLGQIMAIVSNKLKSKYLNSETDTTDDNIRNTEGIALHSSNNNQICITLEKTRLETEDLDGIKKFILANNIVFYYPLKDTQYEDCTPEQSATLDKLYKLSLEKGTNNIFVESENGVTTELQLEYMQDNNLIREQEHKNFEDRITAIENLLSTTATSAMLLDNLQSDLESEVK